MRKLGPNDRIVLTCVGVLAFMIAATYASVPLYRIFCQATGFDGTPRIAEGASTVVSDRTIEVRFDSNVGGGLPWSFYPEQRSVTVHLGENKLVYFHAKNEFQTDTVGAATFNITPEKAATYFNKIQCFCFNSQELKGGQSADMGVTFFVDPAIATDPSTKEVQTITLSYTFFPAKRDSNTVAAVQPRAK
ncbi:MAG: cytochrome c oxidase assembly protein [Alphaproteobacteria bacterium]|nr:cytochrome c oxidase assembly protein [Alphaproteobacteria bacterium]